MTNKKIMVKKISYAVLDWKKGSDYRDKFSEVITVIRGDRSIILDFGVLEEEGKGRLKEGQKEGIQSVNPYIEHHTRIRVSPEHFKAIVEVLKAQLKEMEETKGETE